jgi:DNA-binding MarR family transcriptional regulator
MARSRPVSRQHIQSLVNGLLKDGLVTLAPNPAHQRSHLIQLTKKGTTLVASMVRKERAILSRLRLSLSGKDLIAAAEVLRIVRELFGGPEWERALKGPR